MAEKAITTWERTMKKIAALVVCLAAMVAVGCSGSSSGTTVKKVETTSKS